MTTPSGFKGIFYGPDSGSDAIFGDLDVFLEVISTKPDFVFLTLGAYIDVKINGYDHVAQEISEKARVLKEEDWDSLFLYAEEAIEMASEDRIQAFKFIEEKSLPKSHKVPSDYIRYFIPEELVGLVFGLRSQIVNILHEADKLPLAVMILFDLRLNDQNEVVEEIEKAIFEFWSDLPEENLETMYKQLLEAKEKDPVGFSTNAFGVLKLAFGNTYIVELTE